MPLNIIMAQLPVRFYEICENSHGSRYCTECEQFFCKSCELSHLKSRSCRNHIFKDTDIVNPEVKTPVFKKHGEKLTFYCNTFISLICSIWVPTTHQKHDFCLIDDAASKISNTVTWNQSKNRNWKKSKRWTKKLWRYRRRFKMA